METTTTSLDCERQRKRKILDEQEQGNDETHLMFSPSLEEGSLSSEINSLKILLDIEKEEKEIYRLEAEQKGQMILDIQDQLERVSQERDLMLERMIEESKIRSGIRTTNALSGRLDELDYKTVFSNTKYLALKHETESKKMKEPMVILTKSGIRILKEKWGIMVNKNGYKSTNAINLNSTKYLERSGDTQQLDDYLLNLVLPFYTKPERNEKKPLRNVKNFIKNAQTFGFRGERTNFEKADEIIKNKPDIVIKQLYYLEVFKSVKAVLDCKTSVTTELF